MVSRRFSFRSAHLLMWSSPLLLLVLVFTLTGSTPSVAKQRPDTVSTPVTTIRPTTSTKRAPVTTTSTTTPPPANEASGSHYVSSTSSTVKSTAPEPVANVPSGATGGNLGPALRVVDVPLQGPGSWTLSASAQTSDLLVCATTSQTVDTSITVENNQSCQLEITSTSPGVSLTWQLIPTP